MSENRGSAGPIFSTQGSETIESSVSSSDGLVSAGVVLARSSAGRRARRTRPTGRTASSRLCARAGSESRPCTSAAGLARNSSEIYRKNLTNLVRLILAQGHRVAIVPQYFTVRVDNDKIYEKPVAEHNQVDHDVATALQLPFLDPALLTAFDKNDTFDDCVTGRVWVPGQDEPEDDVVPF